MKICRFLLLTALSLLLLAAGLLPAAAQTPYRSDVPYTSYIYNLKNQPVEIPAPFAAERVLYGYDWQIGELSDLSDVYYDGQGRVYLTDAGNRRVIVLNESLELLHIIDSFTADGTEQTFVRPVSLFCADGRLYIADSGAARIVCLDRETYQGLRTFERPVIELLEDNYVYEPNRVVVDYAGRMYVIAGGINQGLIQLDENGEFMGFMGAPKVVPKLSELIWRKIGTKAQRERMIKFVPTEYNAMVIDRKGFIYVTSQTVDIPPVSRLNSQGENVLKSKAAYTSQDGDGQYTDAKGVALRSLFVDIAVQEDGSYLILDSAKGRVFAYDADGNMLYATGGIGSQNGTYYSPCALELVNGKLLIADKTRGSLTVLAPTAFGTHIAEALRLQKAGDYTAALASWQAVLAQCSNYYTAIIGIAKADIQAGQYENVMEMLEPIGEQYYYNLAFQYRRTQWIKTWFYPLIGGVAVLVACAVLLPKRIRRTRAYAGLQSRPLVQQLKYSNYVIFHPFDGFWDLKREKRGSLWSAHILYAEFVILFAVRTQFSGYLLQSPGQDTNVLIACLSIVLPLVLWCLSNWCFTTLMDGEGSLKDVYISTAYALRPYILLSLPLLLMSHVFTAEEMTFYTVLDAVSVAWVLALLFFGMMITHDYSLSKNVLTTVLTVIGICLMIFIGLLFLNILQDILAFGLNIYKELVFRTY